MPSLAPTMPYSLTVGFGASFFFPVSSISRQNRSTSPSRTPPYPDTPRTLKSPQKASNPPHRVFYPPNIAFFRPQKNTEIASKPPPSLYTAFLASAISTLISTRKTRSYAFLAASRAILQPINLAQPQNHSIHQALLVRQYLLHRLVSLYHAWSSQFPLRRLVTGPKSVDWSLEMMAEIRVVCVLAPL